MNSSEVINRIIRMEVYFDAIAGALSSNPFLISEDEIINKMVLELIDYMESGLWLCDYQEDEEGRLPPTLKRGVLSQDGLYELLTKVKEYL